MAWERHGHGMLCVNRPLGEGEVRRRCKVAHVYEFLVGVFISHVGVLIFSMFNVLCANISCVSCAMYQQFLCFLCSVPAVLVFRLKRASSLWAYVSS
jgi:hypothetical protein